MLKPLEVLSIIAAVSSQILCHSIQLQKLHVD